MIQKMLANEDQKSDYVVNSNNYIRMLSSSVNSQSHRNASVQKKNNLEETMGEITKAKKQRYGFPNHAAPNVKGISTVVESEMEDNNSGNIFLV